MTSTLCPTWYVHGEIPMFEVAWYEVPPTEYFASGVHDVVEFPLLSVELLVARLVTTADTSFSPEPTELWLPAKPMTRNPMITNRRPAPMPPIAPPIPWRLRPKPITPSAASAAPPNSSARPWLAGLAA